MSDLTRARDQYQRAQDAASTARAQYVKALRKQRATGRTWEDIGREVGLTRQRVMRIAREQ
jgi:hypothetical protein